MIVLHVLGRCAIETDAGLITPRAPVVFALGLKLLMCPGRRITRETLLSMLWTDEERDADTRRLLRKNLSEARTRGLRIHGANTNELWIGPDDVRTDVDYLASEAIETLLTRDYTILPGYTPDSAWKAFHDQVDDFRNQTQARIIAELTNVTERQKAEGEWEVVQRLTELLLTMDSSHARANELHARATRILRRRRVPDSALSIYALSQQAQTGERIPPRTFETTQPVGHFTTRETHLQGRKNDLTTLTSSLLNAAKGRANAVYIHGPAGIGKSRLLREFSEIAKADGAAVIQVTCKPEYITQPLALLVTLVPQLLRIVQHPARESQRAKYLDSLLHPATISFSYSPVAIDATVDENNLHYAIQELFDEVMDEQLLVLAIENTHWCHQVSWSLLRTLLSHTVRRENERLFIFTSRDPWHEDRHGDLPDATRILNLEPLDRYAAEQHVREYLASLARTADDALVQWWVKVAEGNPYFHEELINHWATTEESFSTPPSLTIVVDARLGRLTPQALHVLQACSALGEHASIERLIQICGHSKHELMMAFDELSRAGMVSLEYDHTAVHQRLLCRHEVLANRALHNLTEAARVLLHASIGAVLEAELSESMSAGILWSCANHWHEANNNAKAVAFGLKCASHLWNLDLMVEATTACRRTLRFCSDDQSRYNVLRTLSYMLYRQWDWDNLFIVLAGARRLQSYTDSRNASQHDDLELLALDAAWHAERSWRPILEATVRCVGETTAETRHRIKAGIIALKIATNLGDIPLMHQVYNLTRQLRSDSATLQLEKLEFEMIYHAICGDSNQCVTTATALAAALQRSSQKVEALPIILNCGSALVRAGHGAAAVDIYTQVFERAMTLGMPYVARQACHRLITYYLDAEEIESAIPWVDKCDEIDERSAHHWHQRTLSLSRARIALYRKAYDEADLLLGRGADALWNTSMDLFKSAALATKVRVDIARNTPSDQVRPLVLALAAKHEQLCEMGAHDFEAVSLYAGLRHVGDALGAREMLADYILRRRRNTVAPTPELLNAVEGEVSLQLGLSSEPQLRNFLRMWQ